MLFPLPFLMLYFVLSGLLVREDIRYGVLPDKYLCPLLWAGLLYHLCLQPDDLPSAVTGALAGYASFAAIYWAFLGVCHREGMGYGDVKYLAALGAWHGWAVLPVLVLVAALLAMSYLFFLSWRKADKSALKNPLPFGPFLAAAGLSVGWQNLFNLPL